MASLEQSRVYFRGRCRLYTCSTQMSGSDETVLLLPAFQYRILDSIVVSIPACHAGDRGSIPRRGGFFFPFFPNEKLFLEAKGNVPAPGIEPGPAG